MFFSSKFKFFSLFFIPAFIWLFFASPALAKDPKPTIRDDGYQAKYVDQTIADPILIEAGKTRTVQVRFKNVGTKRWERGGKHVSAYTEVPRNRNSEFVSSNWVSPRQTALMQPRIVKSGEIGTLSIDLKAPNKPGVYVEEFYLAAENTTWLKGGYFFLKIKVLPAEEIKKTEDSRLKTGDVVDVVEEVEEKNMDVLKAKKALLSKSKLKVKGGEKVKLVVGFRNEGSVTWEKYSLIANRPLSLASVGGSQLSFADSSWKSHSVILEKEDKVEPTKLIREKIYLRAPRQRGIHTFVVSPMVNGEVMAASAEVEITVTEDAPSHYKEPIFINKKEVKQREFRLKKEPSIRVGVIKNPKEFGEAFRFRPLDDEMIIYDGDLPRGILKKKVVGAITANLDGSYSFKGGNIEFVTNQYVRAVPKNDKHATFLLLNNSRRVKWRGSTDFNIYRGGLEYRTTADGKNNRYFINDLLFEDYVVGIAEASNSAPIEFLKAQSVVARTYAFYIKEFSDKHKKRFFDVVATTGDQLYLGVNNEKITGNYVQATKDTRGQMVTYENEVVITPYFGNTDGRTRSWKEVWGGSNKPWLVSVKAGYDQGRRMYGHGVGMSQRDAAYRAEKEDLGWEELVKYYYSGVEVEKYYN